jgi:hypothetical protein
MGSARSLSRPRFAGLASDLAAAETDAAAFRDRHAGKLARSTGDAFGGGDRGITSAGGRSAADRATPT